MFPNIIEAISRSTIGDLIDILLLTIVLYSFFRLIKDTKAYQMAIGLAIVAVLFLLTQWGNLFVTNWLIKNFIPYAIIGIIVLFQGEIRRFLISLGSRSFRRSLLFKSLSERFGDLFLAIEYLSENRIGALIAVEKDVSLNDYAARGTKIDAELSKELIASIFFPHSPLHDGAVIIQGTKIASAGCLLPLPATHQLGLEFVARTRHLAALGLSQETDALVIVVSEETGTISVALRGQLKKGLTKEQLKEETLSYLK
jgi:diadenylate cyclase